MYQNKANDINPFHYSGGKVTNQLFQSALDFIVSLEGGGFDPATGLDDYDVLSKKYKNEMIMAEAAIRIFGEQIEPKTLDRMQEVYYSFTNATRNRQSGVQISAITSVINSCWDGIGPWSR